MKFFGVFQATLDDQYIEAFRKASKDKKYNLLFSYWYLKSLSDDRINKIFDLTQEQIMKLAAKYV